MKIILPLLSIFALCGCMKRTTVEHVWRDGAVTRLTDWRVNMRQDARFEFALDTNGVKTIRAGVTSGADPTAVATGQKLAEMGLELMKAAK